MTPFDNMLGRLAHLRSSQSRSISAENPTGEKGRGGMSVDGPAAASARELGQGWKVSPYAPVPANTTLTLADIEGPGVIQHIWITSRPDNWRRLMLRFYWDGEATPSIEVPFGDFFCQGWGKFALVNSIPVSVNPNGGLNCYWQMPFRRNCKITVENLGPDNIDWVYYQIDYELCDVPEDTAYLYAQWRRSNPLPYEEVHTLLEGVEGSGNTSARISPGASTITAGGAKARSSFTWMAIRNSPPFVAPARKIISAAPGTLMWTGSIPLSAHPSWACHR